MKNAIHLLQTQTHQQHQSLILTAEDGTVMVIDGGQRPNTPYLLEQLRRITGQEIPVVHAWFLTHAHDDHTDCFFEILEHHADEVEIGKVYFNFPSPQFFTRVPHPDRSAYGTAETFYRLLPLFADKACVVFGGDTYEIGKMKVEVLFSPNFEIEENVCNNSSIVFKITLGGKRILILGDCGIEAGNQILAHYAGTDMLRAEVCQMAHHGQNGVTREFYEAVSPEVCLWCTPKWLWDNDAGRGYNTHVFQTVIVRGWMEELGVQTHIVDMNGTQEYLL